MIKRLTDLAVGLVFFILIQTSQSFAQTTFYRAINLNGSALTIDGNNFEASSTAANYSFTGRTYANQSITLNPTTDANRATMIRSVIYRNSTTDTVSFAISSVPNGVYEVYIYIWEDNSAQVFDLYLNNVIRVTGFNSGPGGTWTKVNLGKVNVTGGIIRVKAKGGDANLSGVEIWKDNTTDTQVPSTVTNLTASSLTSTAVKLNWTAPGDDGATGTATSYELRYSTAAITAANFASATLATGIPVPTPAGTTQSMVITGLSANTTYYFAIKAKDERDNLSLVSNIPNTKTQTGTTGTALYRLNAGGASITTTFGNFAADQYFSTSSYAKSYSASIEGTTNDALYQTERWAAGTLNYSIPVSATGSYTVVLHFAENSLTSAGQRIFDVSLEGVKVLDNYDIVAKAGVNTAKTEIFTTTVTDGVININLSSLAADGGVNNPKISGIEVFSSVADTQAPSAITTLTATALTTNSIRLNWTAPGDDGATGTATSYEVRYSTAAITAANFASATLATGIPVPTAASTAQTMTISGLVANTTYYFAVIAKDEVPNISAISNLPNAKTPLPPDTQAPSAITTLTATALTTNSIRLNWTAPGDDGATGTAASYEVRYSTAAITAANFASATLATGIPVPTAAGTAQTMTISGLVANTTYYFAVIAKDEVPNLSAISNLPSAKTLALTAPVVNAGIDRSIVFPTTNVLLTSTASLSGGTITAYQWTRQSGPTAGTLAGQTTSSLTVTGLAAGTYVFRLTVTGSNTATAFDEVTVTVSATPTAGVPRTFKYSPNYNGNISAIKWNSKYGPQAKAEKIYAYQYDTLNRLKNAYYAEKTGSTFTQAVGHYNEEGITYDRNGNILKLKRFESFNVGKRVMDSLNYRYVGNQLMGVNDVIPAYDNYDNGFTDKITTTTNPDYVYDGNGNMIEDKHKGILIFYNYLNLPDSIHFGNNNYILYDYNATGQKLAKRVFTNNTLTKTTYYDGEYVFEDNQLQFISTEEGRVIPSTKPGQAGQYEYEYFLKDHLGNTRLVINSASPNKYEYLATMESEVTSVKQQEESEFTNIAQTRVTDAANNHTTGGNETAKLNATQGKIIGPGISLKVAPGDTIKMEVWAKFGHVPTADYTQVVGTIASAAAGAYTGGLTEAQRQTVSNAFAGVQRLPLTNTVAPRAYLNYIFFDKSYRYDGTKSGFIQVSSTAATAFEKLALQKIIEQEGYLYIYVANESSANVDVFFDDLKVTQVETPVRSHTDYYPFGLTIAGLSGESAGTNPNKYLYNGIELNDEFGMNLYMAQYRTLDPVLGRWLQVDPEVEGFESLSPYNSNENNPIKNADPEGNCPWCLTIAAGAAGGAAWEYGSQVLGNLVDGKDLGDALTDVDGGKIATAAAIGAVAGAGGKLVANVGGKLLGKFATKADDVAEAVASKTDDVAKVANKADDVGKTVSKTSTTAKNTSQTTTKLSKVEKSKTVEKVGDKFTKTTEVRPGKGAGQSRAEYVRVKNADGKTIKTYKDSYDKANTFQHRKPLRGGPEGRPQN